MDSSNNLRNPKSAIVMRRFYAPPQNFNERKISLSVEESKHLRDVLRLKKGEEVFVFDGEGQEFQCVIETIGRGNSETILHVQHKTEPARPESPLSLTLCVGLLKGEKFDLVIQKATELGVTKIIPVITKRADVKIKTAEDATKKITRWRRLALEAAKQSGRAFVPIVEMPQKFSFVIENVSNESDARFFFSERDGESLSSVLKNVSIATAFVGAEGGWEDYEIEQARNAGWQIITLGGRILRAETAVITVTALLQHALGDLN
jgi:16S rRNA (uracil1498-N3)-methyltransferase